MSASYMLSFKGKPDPNKVIFDYNECLEAGRSYMRSEVWPIISMDEQGCRLKASKDKDLKVVFGTHKGEVKPCTHDSACFLKTSKLVDGAKMVTL